MYVEQLPLPAFSEEFKKEEEPVSDAYAIAYLQEIQLSLQKEILKQDECKNND